MNHDEKVCYITAILVTLIKDCLERGKAFELSWKGLDSVKKYEELVVYPVNLKEVLVALEAMEETSSLMDQGVKCGDDA